MPRKTKRRRDHSNSLTKNKVNPFTHSQLLLTNFLTHTTPLVPPIAYTPTESSSELIEKTVPLNTTLPPQISPSSPSPEKNSPSLIVATINAQKSMLTNIEHYVDFIKENNIDILCIQETGWLSPLSNSLTLNKSLATPFALRQIGYTAFSALGAKMSRTLTTIVHNSLLPIISLQKQKDLNILHLQIKTPIVIDILNTYISHDQKERNKTKEVLFKLTHKSRNPIVLEDLNSWMNKTLNYFSTHEDEKVSQRVHTRIPKHN